MWDALSNNTQSERTEILHNIDDIWGSAALTINSWKVLKGTNYKGQWDDWYGPSGDRNINTYNLTAIHRCEAGLALTNLNSLPSDSVIK